VSFDGRGGGQRRSRRNGKKRCPSNLPAHGPSPILRCPAAAPGRTFMPRHPDHWLAPPRPRRWLLLVLVILIVLAAFVYAFRSHWYLLYPRCLHNPARDWLCTSPFGRGAWGIPASPSGNDSSARLHRAGWSVGDAAVFGAAGKRWLVSGVNGENVVEAEGA